MESVNTAVLWLLSVLRRDEDRAWIVHCSLASGCIVSVSVFVSAWKMLFLAACQLGVAVIISLLAVGFPFLGLLSFLGMEGGKAHIFPPTLF